MITVKSNLPSTYILGMIIIVMAWFQIEYLAIGIASLAGMILLTIGEFYEWRLMSNTVVKALANGEATNIRSRLVSTIDSDRQELAMSAKEYRKWQEKLTLVYVGEALFKTDRKGDVIRQSDITLYRARLSDVIEGLKKEGYAFLAYSKSLPYKEPMIKELRGKDSVQISPLYGAVYMHPTNGIIIVGLSVDEVLNFKPHTTADGWERYFAFNKWRYQVDKDGYILFDDKVTDIPEDGVNDLNILEDDPTKPEPISLHLPTGM